MLDFLKNSSKRAGLPLQSSENIVNFVLGLAILVILGMVVYNFFQNRNANEAANPSTPTQEQLAGRLGDASETINLPADHTVQPGETLWSISGKYYSSGYNWQDIAKANPTVNPDKMVPGTKLTIPKADQKTATVEVAKQPTPEVKPTGDTYTVLKGDTLWAVALRAYGDGYKWVEIAKANNLVNPNIVHVGNILKIPR